ncbi:MAG: helicase RepA family protein [Treponema sp.]|jgi:KaiC/GvpD/RAD55 family RecA-like ATPase|nr:helicase RepA family protein [Treponema sp.]
MSEVVALQPEDQEHLDELIGKYVFDGGMSRIEAEDRALREILEARQKEAGGKKKDPFRFLRIGDLELTPPRWLVKNFLEAGSFCEIFGDPGCGKSFLGIELACRVATGTPFFGFEVKSPGPVYYLAAEGRGGLLRRFHAWAVARAQSIAEAPIFLNETPLSLVDEKSVGDAVTALKKMSDELKTTPSLIVLDTWSRCLAGDDSSPEDAALGVAAVDRLRACFPDVVVVVVHHTGNGIKDRSRGWSGLRAAVDTEFLMTKGSDGIIRLSCTKNKEGEAVEPMAFSTVGIDLGIVNDEGEPVYSAVLSEQDYTDPPAGKSPAAGKNQTLGVELLQKIVVEYSPLPVPLGIWRERFIAAGGVRTRFYELKNSLTRRGKIKVTEDGHVSLLF